MKSATLNAVGSGEDLLLLRNSKATHVQSIFTTILKPNPTHLP